MTLSHIIFLFSFVFSSHSLFGIDHPTNNQRYVLQKQHICEGTTMDKKSFAKIVATPINDTPYTPHAVFYMDSKTQKVFGENAYCQPMMGGMHCNRSPQWMIRTWKGDVYSSEVGWMKSPCGKDSQGNDIHCISYKMIRNKEKALMIPHRCFTNTVKILLNEDNLTGAIDLQ